MGARGWFSVRSWDQHGQDDRIVGRRQRLTHDHLDDCVTQPAYHRYCHLSRLCARLLPFVGNRVLHGRPAVVRANSLLRS